MFNNLLFFLSTCILFSNSCVIKNVVVKEISGIKVSHTFPNMTMTGKVLDYDTLSTNIYFYKDLILYKPMYQFGSKLNGQTLETGVKTYYFVYKKNELFGFLFDDYKKINGEAFLVDSVLKTDFTYNREFYKILDRGNAKLDKLSSTKNKKVYSFKGDKSNLFDTTNSGIITLEFTSGFPDIQYSLSRKLDSIYKMKLTTTKIINNARYLKESNIYLDKIEQYYKLEKLKIENPKVLLSFFDYYKE